MDEIIRILAGSIILAACMTYDRLKYKREKSQCSNQMN
jgi:outer membrane protein assembly factor BamE (lipoprotein component of BamABCDE complex)